MTKRTAIALAALLSVASFGLGAATVAVLSDSTTPSTTPESAPAPGSTTTVTVEEPASLTTSDGDRGEPTYFEAVSYGSDSRQVLDLTVPAGEGPFPLIFWIHGGFWVEGDRSETPFEFYWESGFAVATMNYRFAGDGLTYTDLRDDVETAITLVTSGALDDRIDPDRLIVGGNSAGAHLASLTTFTTDIDAAGVLAFNGPMDLVFTEANVAMLLAADFEIGPVSEQVEVVLGCNPLECPNVAAAASPIRNIPDDAPPFFIQHGTADSVIPYGQAEIMAEALEAAGGRVDLEILEGVGHYVELTNAVDRFLAQFVADS